MKKFVINSWNVFVKICLLQDAFYAMHLDRKYVSKFMKPILIGRVEETALTKSVSIKLEE